MFEIPIWEKYALSIEEAADYFGIGQKKIRKVPGPNELHLEGSEHL